MLTFVCLFRFDTCRARELNLNRLEHGLQRQGVLFGDEFGVKIHVGRQGANRNKRGVANTQQRRDCNKVELVFTCYKAETEHKPVS